MRSSWKGVIVKQKGGIFSGNSTITGLVFEKQVCAHNGKQNKTFLVTRDMLGLKVGEFVTTRKFGKLHKDKKVIKKKITKK